jgi:hypothetical protein
MAPKKELKVEHTWDKIQLLRAEDQEGPYEAFRCLKCGVSAKKRSNGKLIRDPRYKDEMFELCDSARQNMKKVGGRRY